MSVKDLLGILYHLDEENIAKLHEIAKSMLDGESNIDFAANMDSVEKQNDPPRTSGRENLFDQMPEKNQFRDPNDKKLYSSPITPRRSEVLMLQLKCRSCGKENSVPPPLVPSESDRYLCNKCAKSGG